MSFLAPLFLLGTAAVAVPVVFHLIRRSPRMQRVFSSLMFLKASPPRVTRRSRLEQIPLLLLRCAILCLLALAFARPFWKQPLPEAPADAAARKSILLLDASASMQRAGLWPGARGRLETFAARSAPADQVAVFAFDEQLTPLVTFDEWTAMPAGDRDGLVRSRLADLQPGWGSTALDQAIIRCAELLVDREENPADFNLQIVVFTDLQEGSQTSGLQGYEWPSGVRVQTECVIPRQPGNASVQWLPGEVQGDRLAVRVKVSNAPDSTREQFQIGWARPQGDGFLGSSREVYVPAGQSRVVSLDPSDANGNANSVLLRGDAQPFDNRVFVIPPVRTQLTVLFVGPDDGTAAGPLYFLRRALPDTARQEIRVVSVTPNELLAPGEADQAALIVATGAPTGTTLQSLRSALESGATVLFVAAEVGCAPAVARLAGVDALSMTEVTPNDYAMLGDIDYRHPLFAPFADERFSDFTGIHFWRYRRIDTLEIPDAQVLARFDNEDPALLERSIGEGRLILLTSSWAPVDSQLALSSKFVPLLFSLLEFGGRATLPEPQQFVGDSSWIMGHLPNARTATSEGPDEAGTARDVRVDDGIPPDRPGVYAVESAGITRQLAVNLDPRESRTAPLPVDELERLGAPGPEVAPNPVRAAQRRVALHNAELEAHQKLWRWLIVLVLVAVLLETWLAGWVDHRSLPAGRTTA